MDGEIFESGKKILRIQIYPDSCGHGLSANSYGNELVLHENEVHVKHIAGRRKESNEACPEF